MNTRKQHTTSFNSEQGRYNRKHNTSASEEHENKDNTKQKNSKNNKEHIAAEKQANNKTKKKLTASKGSEERVVPTKNTEQTCSSSNVTQRSDEQITSSKAKQLQTPSTTCEQTATSLSSEEQTTVHCSGEQITEHCREQGGTYDKVEQTKPKNTGEQAKIKRNKQTKHKHARIPDTEEHAKPNNTQEQTISKTNEQVKPHRAEQTKFTNTEQLSKPKQTGKQAKTTSEEQTKSMNTEEQTKHKTKITSHKHTEKQINYQKAEEQTKHKPKEKAKTKNAEEQTNFASAEQTKSPNAKEEMNSKTANQAKHRTEEQPESTKTEEQPESTKTEEQPESTKTEEQPESTKTEEQPESTKTEEQPESTKTEEQPESTKTEEQTRLNIDEQEKLMSADKQTEIKNIEEQTKVRNEERIQTEVTEEQTKLKEVEQLISQDSDEQMLSQNFEKHTSIQKDGEHECSYDSEELKSKEEQNAKEQVCSEGAGKYKSKKEHDVEEHKRSQGEEHPSSQDDEHLSSQEEHPSSQDEEHPSSQDEAHPSFQDEEHPSSQDEEHPSPQDEEQRGIIEQTVEKHPSSHGGMQHKNREEQIVEEHKSREEQVVEEHTSSKGETEHKNTEEKNDEELLSSKIEAEHKNQEEQNVEHQSSKSGAEHKSKEEQDVKEHPCSLSEEHKSAEEHRGQEEPCSQSVRPREKRVTFRQSESASPDVNKSAGTPQEDAATRGSSDSSSVPSGALEGEVDGTDAPEVKQWKVQNKKQEENEDAEQENCQRRKLLLKEEPAAFLPDLRRPSFRMEEVDDHQEPEIGMCANCGFLAKLRCANCRQAFYCKRECQREHWKNGHKDQCQPFQVLESAALGRYMVASRDLKAGDVILKEEPIAVGPKQITEPVCLGCYKRVDGSYRCQKCNWPLCGAGCEASPDHLPECVVGQEIGSPIDIADFDQPNHFYEVIFPLRCLALKKKSPKKYEQLLSLESHYEDRKGTHLHQENQKSIVNFLRNYFFIQEFPIEDIDSSEKSIHTITGIIDVNALEIRLKESEVLGLYPTFAMLEHSCTPNTKHAFAKDRQVVVKAAVDIKRGEHISTMYTHILWGTAARRDHLKHSKYFMCTCFRCSDPTELGTHFSALRCKQCTNGFILSAAPLDELATWICTSCNATVAADEVTEINLKLGEEIEAALAMPVLGTLEKLVQRHAKTTVHPNHFHLFAARHTVLQMYGRDPSSVGQESMKKKEKMCQDFLKVCTALDPGMARLAPYAGVALYEYHLAVLARARQEPDAKHVDSVALKKDVETAKALLQQCIRVLQDEPKDQPEGQLCHVAQQNLAELRQWEATLNAP
ncbi:enolase-phosphatase E1 isoform X2 [Procambarus clarkii]|uniref:enolase-phosphatase E1 isoform X2 n=1 Tax=Procambarus clarkii TaxID=6728 RepID=UPI003742C304